MSRTHIRILNHKWEPQTGTSPRLQLLSELTQWVGGADLVPPLRCWRLFCCSCKCVISVYLRETHKVLCVVYCPWAFWEKDKQLWSKRRRPNHRTPQLFIYSVGVWWRSRSVSPNNRTSLWRRRHRRREQQPESIPLNTVYSLQGHKATSEHGDAHARAHTHKPWFCSQYADLSRSWTPSH